MAAYAQSKLALILFTRELASRLKGTGVTAYSPHPGMTKGTDMSKEYDTSFISGLSRKLFFFLFGAIMKTPKEGAATTLYCALDESLVDESGFYYEDCKRKETTSQARSDADARRLWVESLKLVGLEELYVDKILKSSPNFNSNL
ncbi:retinol dehydrogenase 12-like [Bemisia tabaci]|uniref:retinol dehydrogenase 12-like n=1 Tax=Bemisia tabaci TaxID=7038 RepID=UPI003B2823E9